jgi:hypothetical protein
MGLSIMMMEECTKASEERTTCKAQALTLLDRMASLGNLANLWLEWSG